MFESKQKQRELELKSQELDLKKRKLEFKKYSDSRVDIPLKELEELKAENQRLKEKSDALEKFFLTMFRFDGAEEVIHAIGEGKAKFVDCEIYDMRDPLNGKKLLVLKLALDAR